MGVWDEVRELRREGARARGRLRDDGEPEPPAGGWHPVYDDDGNVIPDPPPDEPTDVPAADVEAARGR